MSAWASIGVALLLGFAVSGASAAEANAPPAKVMQVDIRNFAFAPHSITVPVGTRVNWTNKDDEPHRVTSTGNQFVASQALDTGDSYAVTFAKPGTYAYYCSIHPMMVGTIIVQ